MKHKNKYLAKDLAWVVSGTLALVALCEYLNMPYEYAYIGSFMWGYSYRTINKKPK